jgi:hypothetical protein
MSNHKRELGLSCISEIQKLGQILGYHVNLEHAIRIEGEEEGAIDVAWLKDSKQTFPLFIVEVESVPANGMAFNPMKVFSKSNIEFEKPLFFFHLVLSRGNKSSRISALEKTYGTYNYRIYKVALNEHANFLLDVLKQHRKLNDSIDVFKLIHFIWESTLFKSHAITFVHQLRELRFNEENGFLHEFALLTSMKQEFLSVNLDLIKEIQRWDIDKQVVNYRSYLGSHWYYPIHCGLIACSSTDLYEKTKSIKKVIYWQENYSFMTMVGPHFGLNQDYDQFLIWGAGGLLALLSGLFKDLNYAREYFAKILIEVISRTKSEYSIPNLIWLMHICPDSKKGREYFNFAAKKLKTLRSFSFAHSLHPPFLEHDEEFIIDFLAKHDDVPLFDSYRRELKLEHVNEEESKKKFMQLCLMSLASTSFINDLNIRIVQYLYL